MAPVKRSKSKKGNLKPAAKHKLAAAPADLIDEKRETTRINLIRAAIDVFGDKGLEGATVKDISDRAGVNIALVSYYFGGKEKLYLECFEHHGRARLTFAQNLLRAPESADDMRVRMKMICEAILEGHVTDPGIHKMIHRELENELKHAREAIMGTYVKIYELVVVFFESAKKSKIIRTEIDPYFAATIFHSAILQIARTDGVRCQLHKITIQDEKTRRKIADQIIEIFFNGMLRGES